MLGIFGFSWLIGIFDLSGKFIVYKEEAIPIIIINTATPINLSFRYDWFIINLANKFYY